MSKPDERRQQVPGELVQMNLKARAEQLTSSHLKTMFLWPLISGLLLTSSHAQYGPGPAPLAGSLAAASASCESARLIRCQQDILRDMQAAGLNAASVQFPISSGPPYSPAKLRAEHELAPLLATCRLVRSHLDCLILTTPACFETGIVAAQNSDIILRGKRFLEQNGCNEPDTTWQTTTCYRSPEIRACEERYGFTALSSTSLTANATACLAYQAYRYCVETHLRYNCNVHEMDMVNEYLIDRAGDLAWRCPLNQTAAHYIQPNPYALSNPSGSLLSPSGYGPVAYGSKYEQRPIPTYVGAHSTGLGLFGSARDRPWERFRDPVDEARHGISRQPSLFGGTGEVFDRLVAAQAGFDPDSSDCPVRAQPYARECEETLIDQQRRARDSRDGNELQRRTCCSLFQYRDCISRVVLDRCADSSPAAVEILMGIRRREMTITCRGFNRDLCSGALAAALANPILVLATSFLAALLALKQSSPSLL